MVCNRYRVAGHCFSVFLDDNDSLLRSDMSAYEPFHVISSESDLFSLTVKEVDDIPSGFVKTYHQQEGREEISYGKFEDGRMGFCFFCQGQVAGWLVCEDGYRQGTLLGTGIQRKLGFNNAVMILYALSAASSQTALFHASAISHYGRAYLFLGVSGTGKSTHARLWQEYIDGAELVNDDNPVVRIIDGEVRVYGSPWSGKTPCYRNVAYPVGGIVALQQAPQNRIERMRPVKAYASLLYSISGMRWDAKIADGLHEMETELVKRVPMWQLDCLPDAEAARLCCQTVESVTQ